MPIYEYQCSACEHRLEALQKISDPPLTECPSCHESTLKKLVSAASFRLKGGGWYETDFKKDGKKHLAGSDSEAPKDGAGKVDGQAGGNDAKVAKTDQKSDGANKAGGKGDQSGKPAQAKQGGDKKPAASTSTGNSSGSGKSRGQ